MCKKESDLWFGKEVLNTYLSTPIQLAAPLNTHSFGNKAKNLAMDTIYQLGKLYNTKHFLILSR